MKNFKSTKARFRIGENIGLQLFDKNGNVKPLFGLHGFGRFLAALGLEVRKNILFGFWHEKLNVSNLVTNAGKAAVAALINGASATNVFDYLAIGTDGTAAALTQTALLGEITTNGGARAQATASRVTTDVTNDTARLVHTWSFSGTLTIQEIGVFNASSGGTMLARSVLSSFSVDNGDSLQATYDVDVD